MRALLAGCLLLSGLWLGCQDDVTVVQPPQGTDSVFVVLDTIIVVDADTTLVVTGGDTTVVVNCFPPGLAMHLFPERCGKKGKGKGRGKGGG